MGAGNEVFGTKAAGAPFTVYALGEVKKDTAKPRSYAVAAGDALSDTWDLQSFENNNYHLRVYGPNGFFREFRGNAQDPLVSIVCTSERNKKQQLTGNVLFEIINNSTSSCTIEIDDKGYQNGRQTKVVKPAAKTTLVIELAKSFGWYDLSVKVKDAPLFEKRYAGRVETGKAGFTDPLMGRNKNIQQ